MILPHTSMISAHKMMRAMQKLCASASADHNASPSAARDELQETIDDLDRDVERLQNEKRLILEDREEKQELVRYVEEERTVEERWRRAGLATRLKWRLTGMPGDDSLEE